jgi:carboxyl-terminal processing protease
VDRSREQLREVLRRLPAGVKGLVLDLRGNPGGMPAAAADVADLFVPSGLMFSIVSTRAAKVQRHPFEARGEGTYQTDVPMVVLIDDLTASAGTLREHRRAVLVGTPSHGKTEVQSVIPAAGYGVIVLSTGKFYLAQNEPNSPGVRIERVFPDIQATQRPGAALDLARLRASTAAMPERGAATPTTMPSDIAYEKFLRLDAPLAAAVEILGDPERYEELIGTECDWLRP